MIKTNVTVKPTFIEDANLDTVCGAELWARYDGAYDYRITLEEDAVDSWCFDEQDLEEAIEFLTMLRDDLIKRREG